MAGNCISRTSNAGLLAVVCSLRQLLLVVCESGFDAVATCEQLDPSSSDGGALLQRASRIRHTNVRLSRSERVNGSSRLPVLADLTANVSCAVVDCEDMYMNSANLLAAVLPCGSYDRCCKDHRKLPSPGDRILRNTDYPGHKDGELYSGTAYLVQFDIGTLASLFIDRSSLVFPETHSAEVCLEGVLSIAGWDNDWGDLGVPGVDSGAYNCMGRCGSGCWPATGYAKDCAKHDLCSAWKSQMIGKPAGGFCEDPDCGDEAAQTIYGCRRSYIPWWKRIGRRRAAICNSCSEPDRTHGAWSMARQFMDEGNCGRFLGCAGGAGLDDENVR
mmetsp:Transcript_13282/g.35598  ORF Transcript_13282/g.35598 Transcript_13282/m.35598 type:complete len:330 (+) Transcript_13282:59-1048(+)